MGAVGSILGPIASGLAGSVGKSLLGAAPLALQAFTNGMKAGPGAAVRGAAASFLPALSSGLQNGLASLHHPAGPQTLEEAARHMSGQTAIQGGASMLRGRASGGRAGAAFESPSAGWNAMSSAVRQGMPFRAAMSAGGWSAFPGVAGRAHQRGNMRKAQAMGGLSPVTGATGGSINRALIGATGKSSNYWGPVHDMVHDTASSATGLLLQHFLGGPASVGRAGFGGEAGGAPPMGGAGRGGTGGAGRGLGATKFKSGGSPGAAPAGGGLGQATGARSQTSIPSGGTGFAVSSGSSGHSGYG
jgi:hypothetical protein